MSIRNRRSRLNEASDITPRSLSKLAKKLKLYFAVVDHHRVSTTYTISTWRALRRGFELWKEGTQWYLDDNYEENYEVKVYSIRELEQVIIKSLRLKVKDSNISSQVNKLVESLFEAGPPTEGLLALKKELENLGLYVAADEEDVNDFWPYSMIVLTSRKSIPTYLRGGDIDYLEIGSNSKGGFNITLYQGGEDQGPPTTYKSIRGVLASKEVGSMT